MRQSLGIGNRFNFLGGHEMSMALFYYETTPKRRPFCICSETLGYFIDSIASIGEDNGIKPRLDDLVLEDEDSEAILNGDKKVIAKVCHDRDFGIPYFEKLISVHENGDESKREFRNLYEGVIGDLTEILERLKKIQKTKRWYLDLG